MTPTLAFSKSGINVLTATDPDDFVFHSGYDSLKYYSQGTVTMNVNLANYYNTFTCFTDTIYEHYTVSEVSHNLGYVPYFVGYMFDFPSSGDAIQLPYAFGDACAYANINVYATTTKLYFAAHHTGGNSGTQTFKFSYRIFRNNVGL